MFRRLPVQGPKLQSGQAWHAVVTTARLDGASLYGLFQLWLRKDFYYSYYCTTADAV
jgi:hypothetical protein